MDEYAELADFDSQTQRLVIQMHQHLKKILYGNRGKVRKQRIKEFNVRFANIIEFRMNNVKQELKLELDEAYQQIEKLNSCLDKQFEKKWKMKADYESLLAQLRSQLADITACKPNNDKTSHASSPMSD